MATEPLFAGRTLAAWAAAATVTFAIALFFLSRPDTIDPIGPIVESRSALGYAGIADILGHFGAPVVASHSHSRDRLGDGGVLVLPEPRLNLETFSRARRLMGADAVLLILPKWNGIASASHSGWVGEADLTTGLETNYALSLVIDGGSVLRGAAAQSWDHNEISINPVVSEPMQFIRSDKLHPLVAQGDRILVGEIDRRGRRIIVVADPDILSNAGLANPANAAFAIALIGRLRSGEGPVVFDEALAASGGTGPNLFKYLFHFPLIAATVPSVVALILLLWSAIPRFGAPEPEAPALESGKRLLIRNIAALMAFGGQRSLIVRRLIDATVRDVAMRLHAPPQLAGPDLTAWLKRLGNARGVSLDCTDIMARAEAAGSDSATLIALALDINRWKQEMINGPR